MRNFVIILLFFLTQTVFSAEGPICAPVSVKTFNKMLILPGNKTSPNTIYFLQNLSERSLWLDHPSDHPGSAKAGWSSYLQPDHWSAILLTQKDFALSCAIIEPGKVIYLDCSKVLAVCIPEKSYLASKRMGSYWLAENQSLDDLLKIVAKRSLQNNNKNHPVTNKI